MNNDFYILNYISVKTVDKWCHYYRSDPVLSYLNYVQFDTHGSTLQMLVSMMITILLGDIKLQGSTAYGKILLHTHSYAKTLNDRIILAVFCYLKFC